METNDGPTFREAFDRFKADRGSMWSEDTRIAYERRFAALSRFSDDSLRKLRLLDVESEIEDIRVAAGKPTAKAVTYFLNAVCKHAVKAKLLRRHPLRTLTAKVRASRSTSGMPIQRRDLGRFWSWLHAHAAPAERDFILLMLLAGLPRASVADLQVKDVRQEPWLLQVRAVQGRTLGERVILHPVPSYVIERILRPRLATLREGQACLIERSAGVPLRSVEKYLRYGSLRQRTGLQITERSVRKTADVLLRRVVYPNRRLVRAGLTIAQDKDIPTRSLCEAQERMVEMVLDLVLEEVN